MQTDRASAGSKPVSRSGQGSFLDSHSPQPGFWTQLPILEGDAKEKGPSCSPDAHLPPGTTLLAQPRSSDPWLEDQLSTPPPTQAAFSSLQRKFTYLTTSLERREAACPSPQHWKGQAGTGNPSPPVSLSPEHHGGPPSYSPRGLALGLPVSGWEAQQPLPQAPTNSHIPHRAALIKRQMRWSCEAFTAPPPPFCPGGSLRLQPSPQQSH